MWIENLVLLHGELTVTVTIEALQLFKNVRVGKTQFLKFC